jgi:cob(I)alamin adenosyltransferase
MINARRVCYNAVAMQQMLWENPMKTYTGQGDEGYTNQPGGRKVRKCAPICQAIGDLDELSAAIGWCMVSAGQQNNDEITRSLGPIQCELPVICAMLATCEAIDVPKVVLKDDAAGRLERQIDEINARLPQLKHFIIPGGTELSCRLNLARAICRRAERSLAAAQDAGLPVGPAIQKYMNRLSDLLFCLSRLANLSAGLAEEIWKGTDVI